MVLLAVAGRVTQDPVIHDVSATQESLQLEAWISLGGKPRA